MIRFIYGDFGSGKTHEIISMLKKDAECGVHAFLIVPEQQAVTSERMLLNKLPPSAQLNIEVLNFSRLYNTLCRKYGGLEYNYITTPAKHLLMWKNLKELSPLLEYYGSADTDDVSLSDMMLNILGECKANSISSADLEKAIESLEKDSKFYHKMRDISLIYALYNNSVSEKFSDSADDISKLAQLLRSHDFFSGTNVYIDAFTSFTAAEHSVIAEIFAQAENTVISIPLPSPNFDSIYTASLSSTERRLLRSAQDHGGVDISVLTENKRASTHTLSHLSKNLWQMVGAPTFEAFENETDNSVVLESANDAYAEAEAAARWALSLMQSGMRCRDIVVVSRDAEAYRGIIEPAFERNNIPFFFSEKTDLCSKSAVKFILSALMIKNKGWRMSDVISHVKCGFYDISQDQTDMFESYVNTWNIKGAAFTDEYWTMNPDGYNASISERGMHILNDANAVRETLKGHLIPLFAKLDAAKGATEMCRAIYEYTLECKMEKKLADFAKKSAANQSAKEAQEYLSLYSVILNSLSTLASTLKDMELTSSEFMTALKLVFDMSEIGTIPTSVDQVTIGSASMLRADSPKCVIAIGLCDGEFPKTVTDSGILNSPEREKLEEVGIKFHSDLNEKMSDELLYLKRVFSLPSDKLILITSRAEVSGRVRQPSLAYIRAKALLPHVKEHIFYEEDLSYLPISKESAFRYINLQNDQSKCSALRSALIASGEKADEIDLSQKSISTDDCKISKDVAERIFPKDLVLSQSKLEKFVNCNFSYYCSYVLTLREEKEAEFKAAQIGTFIHFILENLIKELVSSEMPICEINDERIAELTDAAVARYIEFVCPESKRRKGSFVHLYRRLRNLSLLLAKNIIEEFSHSEFKPEFFELNIGKRAKSAALLEFKLNDGSTVSLSGVVDRVDVLRRNGEIYVRVVDYKTGSKDFSLDDLKLGLNTQMMIYLFALCNSSSARLFAKELSKEQHSPIPSGVIYLSSNIPTLELEDYKDPEEILQMARSALDRSGLLLNDEDILKAMNDSLSPDFLAGIKKDKKGTLSGKALASAEKFDELKAEIGETIVSIAEAMRSGQANAHPLLHKKALPCDYCEMKPICRKLEKTSQLY